MPSELARERILARVTQYASRSNVANTQISPACRGYACQLGDRVYGWRTFNYMSAFLWSQNGVARDERGLCVRLPLRYLYSYKC